MWEEGGSGVEHTRVKRWVDVAGAMIGLVFLLPLLILVSISIWLEDRGNVVFRQRRGSAPGGPVFTMYKFRSMRREVCRTTRVGKVLRRLSLDELPQFVNVLKGEMSLVGPRPLSLQDLEMLQQVPEFHFFFEIRKQAKPGMTGLWQVSGRRETPLPEMLRLDVEYVQRKSLWFDVWILLRTIPAVLFGKGAY